MQVKKHLQNCQSCQNHHQNFPHHHLKDGNDNHYEHRQNGKFIEDHDIILSYPPIIFQNEVNFSRILKMIIGMVHAFAH